LKGHKLIELGTGSGVQNKFILKPVNEIGKWPVPAIIPRLLGISSIEAH
jgi:hypothetical protein